MTICPICKKPLLADDVLALEWYEPCQWWVLHHYSPSRQIENVAWCIQADHFIGRNASTIMKEQFVEKEVGNTLLP
jgi:hypothetical protein